MPSLPIITEVKTRDDFAKLLITNPGLIIIKFGAEWCGPCKKIEGLVHEWFQRTNEKVQCVLIDVDECFDFYGFLKSKKMVNGIPVIMCYKKGNISFIPDDTITGIEPSQLDLFFKRCSLHLLSVLGTKKK